MTLPSPTALKAMQSFLHYRFLTAKQMVRLGVSPSTTYLQRQINPLAKSSKPLVAFQDYSLGDKQKGRNDRLYWLTPLGNQVMADANFVEAQQVPLLRLTPPLPPINDPTGKPRDYDHRVLFIDAHIAFDTAFANAGATIQFWHTYFDPLNPPKVSMDRALRMRSLPYFPFSVYELKPDGVILAFDADGEAIFAAIELHRFHDTGRIYQQLKVYAAALADGVMQRVYGVEFPCRVLTILDNAGMAERVRKRVTSDPLFADFGDHFWFADQTAINTDANGAWVALGGQQQKLL